jgi:hypothetical protein
VHCRGKEGDLNAASVKDLDSSESKERDARDYYEYKKDRGQYLEELKLAAISIKSDKAVACALTERIAGALVTAVNKEVVKRHENKSEEADAGVKAAVDQLFDVEVHSNVPFKMKF